MAHARPTAGELKLNVLQVARTSYSTLNGDMKHVHWAISHVAQGKVTSRAAGYEFEAQAGSVLVHPPRIAYSEFAQVPGTHEWMVFDATESHNIPLLSGNPVYPVVRLSSPSTFTKVFSELLAAWLNTELAATRRSQIVYRLGSELLNTILDDWYAEGSRPAPRALTAGEGGLAELVSYISSNLTADITRSGLADLLSMHPASMDRLFNRTVGITPMQMLRDMRLSHARTLLETTELTLEQIAAASGFVEAPYLIRVFKSAYHQSPGQYRAGVRSAARGYHRESGLT
jgi:AraC-like DNA-binding protein